LGGTAFSAAVPKGTRVAEMKRAIGALREVAHYAMELLVEGKEEPLDGEKRLVSAEKVPLFMPPKGGGGVAWRVEDVIAANRLRPAGQLRARERAVRARALVVVVGSSVLAGPGVLRKREERRVRFGTRRRGTRASSEDCDRFRYESVG
jgi:hypothetical protein